MKQSAVTSLVSSPQSHPLLKRFVILYLTSAFAVAILLISGIHLDEQQRLQVLKTQENSRLELAKEWMLHDLAVSHTDLHIMVSLPVLRAYLDTGSLDLRRRLENNFLVIAQETRRYAQIRYLDAQGREDIRIDFNNDHAQLIPRDKLQDKSDRYYFRETIALGENQVYVSPLDLNIENGQVEIPYKPMIRFGMPVFDSAGNKAGIVILNYLGNELIKNFVAAIHDDAGHSGMLINSDGYWLKSPNAKDEWGFMFGKKD